MQMMLRNYEFSIAQFRIIKQKDKRTIYCNLDVPEIFYYKKSNKKKQEI